MRIQRLLGRQQSSNTSQPAFIAVLGIAVLFALGFAAQHVWAEAGSTQSAPLQVSTRTAAVSGSSSASNANSADHESSATSQDSLTQAAPLDSTENTDSQVLAATAVFLRAQLQHMRSQIEAQEKTYQALLELRRSEQQPTAEDLRRLEILDAALHQSRAQWNAILTRLNEVEGLEQRQRPQAVSTVNSVPLADYLKDATAAQNAAASAVQSDTQPGASGAQVSADVMQGMLVSHVDPVYPQVAREAHVQGTVVLRAIISKEGKVTRLMVISGSPMLRTSAMDAVQHWMYKPYLLNAQPVEVETTINVNYTLGAAPDLSCTYYDNKNQTHAGTCEERALEKGSYACRADDDKSRVQDQSGCEYKVKRMQAWQADNLSPDKIQVPVM